MKTAVITTGPGVIRPTATASRNCRSVSQWLSRTTPCLRNGTIARPLPKMKAPAFRKKRNSANRVEAPARLARPGAACRGELRTATTRRQGSQPGGASPSQDHQPGGDDQERHFGAGYGGGYADSDRDHPQPCIHRIGESGKFPGGEDDNRNHRWRDPVEERLHGWEPLVADIEVADYEYQQERRRYEGGRRSQCSRRSAPQKADPHSYLRGQRSRHRLSERNAVEKVLPAHPLPLLDQVALHIADGG